MTRLRTLWRFGHLQTRLAVLFTGLFALVLLLVATVGQVMVVRHAQIAVRSELIASGSVFDRLWALKASALGDTASIMARDFGFRAAVASGDRPTIASAVANLRDRAGTPFAFVVTRDGEVIGDGDAPLRALAAGLPFQLRAGRRDVVVPVGRRVYRVVVSPILAPDEVGWVIFALRLDEAEMGALQQLSAIPLTATVLRRVDERHWAMATAGLALEQGTLDRFMAREQGATTPTALPTPDGEAIAIARALPSLDGQPAAKLLLSYPLARALRPYRSLQFGILGAGLLGIALVWLGSRRLAASIARPIEALDEAARALRDGDRTEVAVTGHDEIARLAESFNSMSSEIIEREAQIMHLAFHDTLTGLPNRIAFRQHLDGALVRAKRLGEGLALLCLDLDTFKAVNDTYGHPTGDALLKAIAERLSSIAADGFVARLGGDEFVIVLAQAADPDRPRLVAQAIIDALLHPLPVEDHRISTAASIGIALFPQDGDEPGTLLKHADLALYRAKQDGRGVFRFFEPTLDAAARRRRQIEIDLREALRRGELRLDYQPLFNLASNRISCFEALLRWNHPERGSIPPGEFIPVAEESGLIVALGEWVLHEACREAAAWPEDVRIAVNVSPLQIRNPGLLNIVTQALSRSGLSPRRLELEITETVFLDGTATTLDFLHRLHALGVRVALDDFGTGYSSLSYLQSFPFDKIKIDRAFVTGVVDNDRAAAIVRAVVGLAQAFDMESTAEGVEHHSQLEALRALGCNSIQGFHLGRPLSARSVTALFSTAPARPAEASRQVA